MSDRGTTCYSILHVIFEILMSRAFRICGWFFWRPQIHKIRFGRTVTFLFIWSNFFTVFDCVWTVMWLCYVFWCDLLGIFWFLNLKIEKSNCCLNSKQFYFFEIVCSLLALQKSEPVFSLVLFAHLFSFFVFCTFLGFSAYTNCWGIHSGNCTNSLGRINEGLFFGK